MKTAFITGASSGFGKACVDAFIQENYKVIALARRKERLKELKEKYKDQIYTLCIDIRNQDIILQNIEKLPQEFKNIDILFNNAGLALGTDEFDKLSLEDINTMVDTNIKGFLYITKALIPILRKQKNAYIFNLGSVAARNPYFGGNVYCRTKAFVGQFSLALRNDLRGSNIKVTNIAPGLCKTEFSQVRFKGDIQKANALYENTQFISANDIAKVVMSIINLPQHINVNEIELMPITQTWNGFYIERTR
ncbi:SDR family NAD(P)-dependent oxidoreductase [Campylobacter hepaticus]